MDLSGFKWVEYLSKYNEDFIKSYNKESDEGYFLEVEVQSTKDLHDLHNDLLVLHERMKTLLLICMIKMNMLLT